MTRKLAAILRESSEKPMANCESLLIAELKGEEAAASQTSRSGFDMDGRRGNWQKC